MHPSTASMTKAISPQDENAFAQQALALMQKHGLPPAPNNYAVWFGYSTGENKALVLEVDNILNNGMKFTQETCTYLYNKFFMANQSQKTAAETANGAQKILVDILKVINEFGGETQSYTDGMDGYIENLSKEIDNPHIQSVVKDLISATSNLKARGAALNDKLAESTNEINALKKNLKQVTIESQRDHLTGVFNRKTFEEYVDEQFRICREKKSDLCLMMIDIDHFKQFNDRFGHLLGDEVLKIVAKTLTEILKGRDIVARFGGEEFVVVLPETPLDGAMKVADITRLAIANKELKRKDNGENYGSITVSMGVSHFRHDSDTLPLLIKRADDALYESKRNGRNRVTQEK